MTIFAQINVPARMGPSLAATLGELLTSRSRTPGLGAFVGLSFMFQSWRASQATSLGELFGALRANIFSPTNTMPLEVLGASLTYLTPARRGDVGEVMATHAAHFAAHNTQQLASLNVRVLQQEADALVAQILTENADAPNSVGRHLFMVLHETINSFYPDMAPINAAILSGVSASRPASSPADATENTTVEREQQLAFQPAAPSSAEPTLVGIDPLKPSVQVFDRNAVIERLQKTPPPESPMDGNIQQYRLLEEMANNHGVRMLSEVPEGNPIAELYNRFPHFSEVLDFISQNLALAGCGDEGNPARLPPLLLRGDAGVGKTCFAQELARVLGTHFIERDLSVTSEAFVLSGMDSTWKGSKPGIVFDALVMGKTANPVILLNELDKSRVSGTHSSPMAALHALLEPTSASRFVDEFVPVEIDASRVIWICTANDGEIPEPILSRLEVFDIRQPTYEECRQIAASVWKSICNQVLPRGHGFPEQLNDAMVDATARMSPRVMRKALTLSASAAVVAGRRFVLVDDLAGSQKRYAPASAKQAIGFLPTT